MHKPLFSIITVSFNAEKTIERTITSVEEQIYADKEFILIDGASKDHTLEIAQKHENAFTKIISEPDKGIYDAMNKGIKAASGCYLCFLNAGDKFHDPSTLQDIANDLLNKPNLPDIIYGDTDIVNNEGLFLYKRRLSPPEHLNWKSFQQGMLVCHQSFYVKRELSEPYDLHYRLSADFDWCIKMMKKAHSLYNTHRILTDYLNEGMTTHNHKESLKERFLIMGKNYGFISTTLRHIGFIFRNLFN